MDPGSMVNGFFSGSSEKTLEKITELAKDKPAVAIGIVALAAIVYVTKIVVDASQNK